MTQDAWLKLLHGKFWHSSLICRHHIQPPSSCNRILGVNILKRGYRCEKEKLLTACVWHLQVLRPRCHNFKYTLQNGSQITGKVGLQLVCYPCSNTMQQSELYESHKNARTRDNRGTSVNKYNIPPFVVGNRRQCHCECWPNNSFHWDSGPTRKLNFASINTIGN